ncbi:uncharacterized protein LOC131168132 [Malania oleifera]|uniref:uncharacterized protein LOC131168132 n=1 Tax=Malania oleifera TaxID=397392 RepID=UPI0025AEB619|nr:uncharacterized protein LOC131168132 [Malania oleifera]
MNSSVVQHVTKASSDELLRKFAEQEPESCDEAPARKEELRLSKRRKRSQTIRVYDCKSPLSCSSSLAERRSLLPPAARRSAVVFRQLGIGRFRARDIKNRSILETIEKTWRKTVEGASKVFVEKHYSRHKRLVNDVV